MKVSRSTSKTYTYPMIRLPKEYAHLIGQKIGAQLHALLPTNSEGLLNLVCAFLEKL
jgi:hypothetical protein